MVNLLSHTTSRLAVILVVLCLAAIGITAQTPAELRAKYGSPQMSKVKNNHPILERYLVRPNILMTIRYTKQGLPCEAVLEPVPFSTPKEGRVEHAADGDYMSTAEVIKLINELAPIEKRGKRTGEGSINGGDPEMKLHHPGCWGAYFAYYEHVSLTSSTWCWGGTFSATIHWGKASCRGQTIKFKKKTRTDLSDFQRIHRTVLIKGALSAKYVDVVKLIDLLKELRADPIGLQIHRLPA